MSSVDNCIVCTKLIKPCHKNISCNACKSYVHKKCTKLKPKELKQLCQTEWICSKCKVDDDCYDTTDSENEFQELNISDADLEKYDKMLFNPLRFETILRNDDSYDFHVPDCSYIIPTQFKTVLPATKNDAFTVLNVNIRSLSGNFEKLKECIKTVNHDFSIIGLSETHLKDKPHDYYNLPGYRLEYVNRVGRNRGGVCMYITNNVNYKVRNDLCNANSNYESCFIEIERKNAKNILVGVIYRSHTPIDNFALDMVTVFNKINAENKMVYVMGDFNIDLLKDDTDRATHDYIDLIYSHSLIPTIYKPTRITETSATIIDNILTNCESIINSTILVTDISDHFPTVLISNLSLYDKNQHKNKCFYKRLYNDDNVLKLKKYLSELKWEELFDNINAEDDYSKFVTKFQELYDECIPLKKCTSKPKKEPRSPWITKGLLCSINTKNKLYKQYLRCPSIVNHQLFKTFRNKLHGLLRKSKRLYFFKKFEQIKGNMRQTWKTINNVLGRAQKQGLSNQFKRNTGTIITDPTVISNEFNDFFVNVGPALASQIHNTGKNYYDYLNSPCQTSIFMKPIVETEIMKIISKFDQNKSAGHDDIGNFIVKKVANEICHPLALIFNLSLLTGNVPDQLKIAKVIPIFKKDDADIFSNYRPVSVLPCFSKVLERLVFNRCIEFIDKNNLLNEKQFGFRANHSTNMAIMQLVDKINNAVEQSKTTLGVFLDLSKAFDTIDHDILLYKLELYGFRGVVKEWFKNYLSDRKQYVKYNDNTSELKNIICGVPQGSILGPLLFILYINDITNTSAILEFILFADDTTILYSSKHIVNELSLINRELSEVSNWFKANKLSVNASKTNYMIMGTPKMTAMKTPDNSTLQPNIDIILDDTKLQRVAKTKFLGVIIDENLTWKDNIDGITKTISRNIGVINKVKYFLPERILHTLYCTLVLPYVNYGILVWGSACKMYLEKLHKLQKWAVRSISNSHYRSHSKPLFYKYNILNIYDAYKLEVGVFMYKYFSGSLPNIFDDFFTKRSDIHNYHTRNSNNYNQTRNKKVFSDQAVRTTGPILWNSLNDHLKNVTSVNHFRNKYKATLLLTYN